MVAVKELKDSIDETQPNSREYKAWQREKKALKWVNDIQRRHGNAGGLRHIMEVTAIISKGGKQYFMFPLADKGNLFDFIHNHQTRQLDSGFAKYIIRQLTGLAEALRTLHGYKDNMFMRASYRHGDLKPENILIHNNTWKITDLGHAKYHEIATKERLPTTTQLGGTVSYEPPEAFQAHKVPTSRLFDIWSMGCIILQLSLWLLDSYETIGKLATETYYPPAQASLFWDQENKASPATLHPAVGRAINQIRAKQRATPTSQAIGTLLDLVKGRLLVVALPSMASLPGTRYRAHAKELHTELQKILYHTADAYWFSGQPTVHPQRNQNSIYQRTREGVAQLVAPFRGGNNQRNPVAASRGPTHVPAREGGFGRHPILIQPEARNAMKTLGPKIVSCLF